MEEDTYNIRRFYENENRDSRIVQQDLTLEQARRWCNDPETSSYTAQPPKGCGGDEEKIQRWHDKKKHWFDGFERA
ncbi:MAG: hypothetical protein II670_10490 [Alphaproteobacteria bacterium]|nr:hypothetical protein [Alphaproteobacteria bacterium]